VFTVSFLVLGYLGVQAPTPAYSWMSRFFAIMYFFFFLALPAYTASAEHPVANLYRLVLRLALWAVIAGFALVWGISFDGESGPGTPFTLFVVAMVLVGVLVEATRFLRKDQDLPVPERLT